MYREIHNDISYFDRDTKQSNLITRQNAKKNTKLSVVLTSV